MVHGLFKLLVVLHRCAGTGGYQSFCFSEVLIVRSEEHGYAIYGGLYGVVYADAEPAADVGHLPVLIDRREHAECVEQQHARMSDVHLVGFGVAHVSAVEYLEYLVQMGFVYLVGHEHEFGVFVRVHVACQQLLVLRPRAARYDHLRRSCHESFHRGYLFGVSGYLVHAVEACVAGHGGVRNAVCLQQLHRCLVLHVDVCEVRQQPQIGLAPRQEEQLFGSEYGGHAVGRNALSVEFHEVGGPELVFDKDSLCGLYERHESPCFAGCGKGQIGHYIHFVVILSQLVSGGREEGE